MKMDWGNPALIEWSPDLAYAIGLLVTDGNLSKDGRHITLRSSDKEQIENFARCLQNTNRIGINISKSGFSNRPSYRIQISNRQLYGWLLTQGIAPAKTYTIGPISVPDKFFQDFLRGHLDGDGSITFYQDWYNAKKDPQYIYWRLVVRFISASRVHAQWLQLTIERLCGIRGAIFEEPPRKAPSKVSVWVLKFMKKDSLRILSWIYYAPGIVCLKRKRAKAERAIFQLKQTPRKQYTWTK